MILDNLRGSKEEALADLERAGILNLKKALAGRPMYSVTWEHREDPKFKEVITKRAGGFVYFRGAAMDAYPPGGSSSCLSIGKFLREYRAL